MRDIILAKILEHLSWHGTSVFNMRWAQVFNYVVPIIHPEFVTLSPKNFSKATKCLDLKKEIIENLDKFTDDELVELLCIVIRRSFVCM